MIHSLIPISQFASGEHTANPFNSSVTLIHGSNAHHVSQTVACTLEELCTPTSPAVYISTHRNFQQDAVHFSHLNGLSVLIPTLQTDDQKADYADAIFASILQIVESSSVRTFVIDSLTRISALSFGKNASSSHVLKRLCSLAMRHGLTLIVTTHALTSATLRSLIPLADEIIDATPPPHPDSQPTEPQSQTTGSHAKTATPTPHAIPPTLTKDNNPIQAPNPTPAPHAINPPHASNLTNTPTQNRKKLTRRDRRILRRTTQKLKKL